MIWQARNDGLARPARQGVDRSPPKRNNRHCPWPFVTASQAGLPLTAHHAGRRMRPWSGAKLLGRLWRPTGELIPRPASGMTGAVWGRPVEIRRSDPERYVLLQQFSKPRQTPRSTTTHSRPGKSWWTTPKAPWIVLVAGVGTGGHESPASSRYIKRPPGPAPGSGWRSNRRNQPGDSAPKQQGQPWWPGPHKSRGSARFRYPITLDLSPGDSGWTASQQRRGRGGWPRRPDAV